ncbi:FKBP-type peptidyl-prolyl cis-trans isomerase [Microbacterium pygmaeum]|uniref:peptidylprolyl isomerase n=1 Tax=Microbacterium pygmaeum TaxID=370764 RepID=A0A1G8B8P1_9MICO|nr:FKBP-type peptidyl-prolyl cis-trans isomerase [Microbacterium pygmaeum]SDH29471.1 peptidylprolyl isomerase [Microbacterium pygmaeum]
MRKIPASFAVLGLLGLALVGCSSAGGTAADCPRPAASASTALGAVEVTGATDELPDVQIRTPFHVTAASFQDLAAGEGPAIVTDDQLVVLDIAVLSGATGDELVATPYDGDLSRVFPVSTWLQTFPGIDGVLDCAAAGSRIVVALAPEDIDTATAASIGLAEDDSAVAVIDVRKVYLPAADGAPQFNSGAGLPTVVRAPDGRPGIIVPDADPPKDVAVQTLLKGDGPEVTGEDPVRVHYTGLTWADRTVFDTTWDGEPASLTLDAVVPGFAEALQGQTVGSQVLVVVPPDQGYGSEGSGSVPPDSTLVFVVDILGIDQAPAQ